MPKAGLLVPPPPPPVQVRPLPRAVVVVPTYNEALTLERTVQALDAVAESVRDYQVDILVVDSNSPDGTADLARRLQARYPRLHVLVEPHKSGLGGAYLLGMRHAVDELGADVLFEFDADLSHDPSKIPLFLERFSQGDDFVVGTRYTTGGGIPPNWAWHRKFLSVVGNRVIRLALGHRAVSDWTGGFRAMSRSHFERLEAELRPYTSYTFQTAFLHKAVLNGARVSEVPYRFQDRTAGDSKFRSSEVRAILGYLFHQGLGRLEAVRMLLVGGLGVVVNLVALSLLVEVFKLSPPSVANLVAAQFAVASNFYFNDRWTFARRGKDRKLSSLLARYVQFALGSLVGVVFIQSGAIWLGGSLFGTAALDHKGYLLYWLIGTALLFAWNYTVSSRVIWRAQPGEAS